MKRYLILAALLAWRQRWYEERLTRECRESFRETFAAQDRELRKWARRTVSEIEKAMGGGSRRGTVRSVDR